MTIVADSISGKPHLAVFDNMVEQRISEIDFSPVIPLLVDNAPENMLPLLASQFDVMGYKGMRFATTAAEQRELIKRAIKLHKYKGTPYAIKESLKALGITNVIIKEHILLFVYDGIYNYDASLSYGESQWATFRIVVDASAYPTISTSLLNDIKTLVNTYKNARSHLIDVSFGFYFNEAPTATDTLYDNNMVFSDTVGPGVYYSSVATYNSGVEYNRTLDDLTIDIL